MDTTAIILAGVMAIAAVALALIGAAKELNDHKTDDAKRLVEQQLADEKARSADLERQLSVFRSGGGAQG